MNPDQTAPKGRECSGSVVECLTETKGPHVLASLPSLHCGP